MTKTVLITGSTDGIGLETAKTLVCEGHHVLLHGRNPTKLEKLEATLSALSGAGPLETYVADLSVMSDVEAMTKAIRDRHTRLDVLINNAGVYNAPEATTQDGLDVRFAVNTVAPYLITKRLLPLLGTSGRVINLSSAAQAPVNLKALRGEASLSDGAAYAQSKLALNMWSRGLALSLGDRGPAIIAVNPGSLLATKMVKDAFGVPGSDVRIGADVLVRATLTDEFGDASGQYFDNDAGRFAPPHPDGLDPKKIEEVMNLIDTLLGEIGVS